MKKAFVSYNIASDILDNCGIEPLVLLPYEALDAPVNSHADMLVFVIENKIFCYKSYYEQNKAIFEEAGKMNYEIIQISKLCKKDYPNDISLNALIMGKTIFANLKHTAVEILEYANKNNYKLVNVNQGYCACATLALDENNAITADKSIYKALLKEGKRVELISPNGIDLQGYNCGFIGGASFVADKNVYFFGDIKAHPDYEKIHKKIKACGMKEFSISQGDVFDFGGIKLLKTHGII